MSQARNAILARLKKQPIAINNLQVKTASKKNQHLNTKQTTILLIEKLKENRAEVHCVNNSNWKDTLVKLAQDRKLNTWLLGTNILEIEQAGKALTHAIPSISLVPYSQAYEAMKKTLFHDIEASITLAKAAIADTGTLVLIPDQNEPRMMSLTPPVHVVLVKEADINFGTTVKTANSLPNPAELLMSSRMKTLFDKVSDQYDYVIVDTAPSMLVTDTLLFSQYAGHTVYLTRAGYTEKRILNFAKELHTDKKLNGMMLVVNDVKQSNFGYGAKYGYYGKKEKKGWFKRKA